MLDLAHAEITIASRRTSSASLLKKYPNATIIDVTSRGDDPWVRFSLFFPHGSIPIPFSPGQTAASVEGIWQGLKVFEKADIDLQKFSNTTMKGIKRSSRTFGKVQGHRAGVSGDRLFSYAEARKQIYLPCYKWILENCLTKEVEVLRRLASTGSVLLLDYETNSDVTDLSRPLSHASLVRAYLQSQWPG
jgi:hypothetical protein